MPHPVSSTFLAISLVLIPGWAMGQGIVSRRALPVDSQPPQAAPMNQAPYGEAAPGMMMPPSMALQAPIVDPNRRLKPGDQLSIRIEQDNDPAVPIVVGSSGDVVVEPLEQGVRILDMTVPQAQEEIKRRLEKDYYYKATVRLTLTLANSTAAMGMVYISGAITRVGAVGVSSERPLMLSQAILSAGGFGRRADQRKIKVTRPGRNGKPDQTFVRDMKQVLQKGRMEQDMQLMDGDQIFVPETFVTF